MCSSHVGPGSAAACGGSSSSSAGPVLPAAGRDVLPAGLAQAAPWAHRYELGGPFVLADLHSWTWS